MSKQGDAPADWEVRGGHRTDIPFAPEPERGDLDRGGHVELSAVKDLPRGRAASERELARVSTDTSQSWPPRPWGSGGA